MALPLVITVLLFTLAVTRFELSACDVVKGSVSCLDCGKDYDFAGIKVLVKCDQVKKPTTAITKEDGSFEAELPTSVSPTPNCLAMLLGGPDQLYGSRKNAVSTIVKAKDEPNSYTISNPLVFFTTCTTDANSKAKCSKGSSKFGSSETIDLPLPREWGFPPTSYYTLPFIPIIGIP
ncbi:hypothetical protein RJ641_033261 [Dillenia turbinata]|uniref:Uncharacterized protein n=1 Tax=Dillenia turbinata TaxID=194707 RepID=A0AAN8VUA6_9MAGN